MKQRIKQNKWSKQQIELVLQLAREKVTRSQIANKLAELTGLTVNKNMIVSIINRARDKGAKIPMLQTARNTKRQRVPKPPKQVQYAVQKSIYGMRVRSHRISAKLRQAALDRLADEALAREQNLVPFAEIAGKSRCKYSPPNSRYFCGAPVPLGQSWCPCHKAIVFSNYKPILADLEQVN